MTVENFVLLLAAICFGIHAYQSRPTIFLGLGLLIFVLAHAVGSLIR